MEHFVWNASPEIFSFGSFAPRWYGLCFALGIWLGFLVMKRFYAEVGRTEDELSYAFYWFLAGTIIGARVGHCLFYEPAYYLSNPLKILAIWEGGLASHGGTIGIFICMIIYTQQFGVPFFWMADRLAIAISLGVPFIRIGNFFNSEIYGRATDLPWAVVFKRVDDIPRHPAQLYEALAYFAIHFFLRWYDNKNKNKLPPGRLVGMLLVLVFTARFLIEFVKENQVDFESTLPLNMGQLLSIPVVAIGFMLIFGLVKGSKSR